MCDEYNRADCESFEILISAKLDGELSELEETVLAEHLNRCESCRLRSQSFARLNAWMTLGGEDTTTLLVEKPAVVIRDSNSWQTRGLISIAASIVVLASIVWFNLAAQPDTAAASEEYLKPLILLQEINEQRSEDQERMRESLEMDLRTLKLQLVSLDQENAELMSNRINDLMLKITDQTDSKYSEIN